MSDTVFFNGSYLPKRDVRISPDDRGFLFSDGIYEVVRMYRVAALTDRVRCVPVAKRNVSGRRSWWESLSSA